MNSSLKKAVIVSSLFMMLAGCASGPNKNPADPLEPMNRGIFKFNNAFYYYIAEPVTKGYSKVMPDVAQEGITNFFHNAGTVPDIVNDLLQANFYYFGQDFARLFLNTTVGIVGLIDVGSYCNIPSHEQSFDYTLAKWGVKNPPYLILPVLGPSTFTGVLGLASDYFLNPLSLINPPSARYQVQGLQIVQTATYLLPKQRLIMQTALDPYVALREAYLQNREYVIDEIRTDGADRGQ